jgi:hypothetical protein
MANIKVGQTAFMRVTGEEVVILNTFEMNDITRQANGIHEDLDGLMVTVRRPVQTRDSGLQYVTETYYIEELETKDEMLKRQFDAQKAFRKQMQALDEADEAEATDAVNTTLAN